MNLLIAGGLVVSIGLGIRYLLRARRSIRQLQNQLSESARLMAQINMKLAQQLFVDGHFTEAAQHESLATTLENLANQPGMAGDHSGVRVGSGA